MFVTFFNVLFFQCLSVTPLRSVSSVFTIKIDWLSDCSQFDCRGLSSLDINVKIVFPQNELIYVHTGTGSRKIWSFKWPSIHKCRTMYIILGLHLLTALGASCLDANGSLAPWSPNSPSLFKILHVWLKVNEKYLMTHNKHIYNSKVHKSSRLSYKHTHAQSFYCSSGICPGPPGWAGTRKVIIQNIKYKMQNICTNIFKKYQMTVFKSCHISNTTGEVNFR